MFTLQTFCTVAFGDGKKAVMKNYRYGKFRFADYYASWVAITILLIFSIASFFLKLHIFFIIFPIVYALLWILLILSPHREQFILCDNSITVFDGKKSNMINLPPEFLIVVSYADICPPFSVHSAIGNQTHILKGRYAVSILHKIPLGNALEALHKNHIKTYTTSRIKAVFDAYLYIYDFMCNQALLDELMSNSKNQLIIPESLLDMVVVDSNADNVHVDFGH